MAYGVKLLVWGDFASFNRPEMKVERVTYDVITPSAARGILEAIYWKPEMRWVVDRLRVLNPIRFTHVRRNEIKGVIPVKGAISAAMKGEPVEVGIAVEENRQQRAAMIMRDVRYGIEAHVEVRKYEGPED
ncbi:MAG TPA: type I-C CRISPR-associated protein Cas5, partial [Desulfobacteraceae bacterium]|nr:type I-C CRISPR-associated protein Cas5 [Desulfobacteraceae bacterium]